MSEKQYKYINSLLGSYPKLNVCKNDIIQAYEILRKCYSQHHKLLICGNGGSAADSEHIVGELMKGFTLPRKVPAEMSKKFTQVDNDLGNVLTENLQEALPSIALTTHAALSTAFMNDCQPVLVFTDMPKKAIVSLAFPLRVIVRMSCMQQLLPRRKDYH